MHVDQPETLGNKLLLKSHFQIIKYIKTNNIIYLLSQ